VGFLDSAVIFVLLCRQFEVDTSRERKLR